MIANLVDALVPMLRRSRILRGAPSRSRPGIPFVDVGPAVMRCRVSGSGAQTIAFAADPPVVIEQYDELVSLLEERFRVVVFEVPGFGFSLPTVRLRFDFESMTALAETFLVRLGFGPYVLAYPCVTAYSAVALASRAPALVSHLVLIQAPSWAEELRWKMGRDPRGILSTPVLGQLALQLLKRRRAPAWFTAALGSPALVSQFAEQTDWAFRNGACFCLASAFQRFLVGDPSLPPVRQPTLIVWGDRDRSHAGTDKSSTWVYAPHASEVRIEPAGHFPELEAAPTFAHALQEWMGPSTLRHVSPCSDAR
jgi:pimeloyl-ACP methyl ester carboxylesterase